VLVQNLDILGASVLQSAVGVMYQSWGRLAFPQRLLQSRENQSRGQAAPAQPPDGPFAEMEEGGAEAKGAPWWLRRLAGRPRS